MPDAVLTVPSGDSLDGGVLERGSCPSCKVSRSKLGPGNHSVILCAIRLVHRSWVQVRRLRAALRRRTLQTGLDRARIVALERVIGLRARGPVPYRSRAEHYCWRCSLPKVRPGMRVGFGFIELPGYIVNLPMCEPCFNLVYDLINPERGPRRAIWRRSVTMFGADESPPRTPSPGRTPGSTTTPET